MNPNPLTIRLSYGVADVNCAECGYPHEPSEPYAVTRADGAHVCNDCARDVDPDMLAACRVLCHLVHNSEDGDSEAILNAITRTPYESLMALVTEAHRRASIPVSAPADPILPF